LAQDSEFREMFVGRVYKIWAPGCERVYVGSTKQTLANRFRMHKASMTCWQKHRKKYMSSFDILAYNDAEIDLITEEEFNDIQDMRECEKYWISKLDTVNQKRPMCTEEEHRQRKRDNMRKHYDRYRARQKEYSKSYVRIKYQCPHCDAIMRSDDLKRHIKAKHPINGAKTWQRAKKRCPHCDKAVTATNLRRHIKGQHHINGTDGQ